MSGAPLPHERAHSAWLRRISLAHGGLSPNVHRMHSLLPSDDHWKNGVLERVGTSLVSYEPVEPLGCDRWIASSAFQKGIRRGDLQLALRAALVLSAYSRSYTWRRLLVIAFEDVGTAEIDVLIETVAVATTPKWRAKHGELSSLAYIIRRLAQAPKDRSADYLISAASNHPSLSDARRAYGLVDPALCLQTVVDQSLPLSTRALAAWLSSGVEGRGGPSLGGGSLAELGRVFQSLGANEDLLSATKLAARRTREPITVVVPLIWLEAHSEQAKVCDKRPPACPVLHGVPMYAFDKHTRLGLAAIQKLTRESDHIRNCLKEFVPQPAWLKAVQMAVFYTDGYVVSHRLHWSLSDPLEHLGVEADFCRVGVAAKAIGPLRLALWSDLARLNEIRSELWESQRSPTTLR